MSVKNIIQTTVIAAAIFAGGTYVVDHYKLLDHSKTNSGNSAEASIKKVIEENPEWIVKSIENWHYNKIATMQQEKQKALTQKGDEFKQDNASPILGNKNGSIVIVEFFDYLCGYCKKVAKTVDNVIANHPDVKVILKPVPIMGNLSSFIEKAAIAVYIYYPDKFADFDKALLQTNIASENDVIKIATGLGIEGDKLRTYISKPEVNSVLDTNIRQAQEIGVSGTPAFIINNQLFPGALDEATFDDLIKKAGGNSTNKPSNAPTTAPDQAPALSANPEPTATNNTVTVEIPVSVKPAVDTQPPANNQPTAPQQPMNPSNVAPSPAAPLPPAAQ